jgi:hypothetical protein
LDLSQPETFFFSARAAAAPVAVVRLVLGMASERKQQGGELEKRKHKAKEDELRQ